MKFKKIIILDNGIFGTHESDLIGNEWVQGTSQFIQGEIFDIWEENGITFMEVDGKDYQARIIEEMEGNLHFSCFGYIMIDGKEVNLI